MRYSKLHIENRIDRLSKNEMRNWNLIRKWKRMLRKANEKIFRE